jgi:hypothetical protein
VNLVNLYFTNQMRIVLVLRIKRMGGLIADHLYPVLDHFRADQKNSIYSTSGNDTSPESKKIAIIASHIKSIESVSSFVYPLRELISNGYFICLIDTGKIELTAVNSRLMILKRENIGRDFGSFRDALAHMRLSNVEDLVLMNDSCFWKRNSLDKFLRKMKNENSDVRCLTLSFQKISHPQSFLLHFKKPVIRMVNEFFESEVRNWKSKRNIVNRGEIGLARRLNDAGITVIDMFGGSNFMYNSKNSIPKNSFATNTMEFHAREIYRSIGVIKTRQINLLDSFEAQDVMSNDYSDLFYAG